jgi:hypothetical protein
MGTCSNKTVAQSEVEESQSDKITCAKSSPTSFTIVNRECNITNTMSKVVRGFHGAMSASEFDKISSSGIRQT